MKLDFGSRLRAARERRDMSVSQLAERADINVTQISHFEIGTRQPGADNIRKLAPALDITADFLLGLSAETRRIVS
jgi:transcriptional regulator with XRE-family HTH domain